jgi:hypothetical protein
VLGRACSACNFERYGGRPHYGGYHHDLAAFWLVYVPTFGQSHSPEHGRHGVLLRSFFFFAIAGWATRIATHRRHVGGLFAQILTVSRSTIAIAGVGYLLVLFVSGLKQWTSRKTLILVFATVALLVSIPLILSSIEQRASSNDTENSDTSRDLLPNFPPLIS